ncbi:MAG: M48 family metallopeptidase, partial [Planctomycetota bacterium]|nr:M48 family metallopeptidase [Planctomycetota bacterium]
LITLATLTVIGVAMLYKTARLRSGGAAVAKMLGGREVSPSTKDPLERRLINVVEEMAIASGSPVPEVFILQNEEGLNAFAAGWTKDDAAIAVTRGLLEKLNRDELQGVIAHEFSHVFHGDMRLNIRLMGILFGIVCIATIGEILMRTLGRTRSRNSKNNGAAAIVLFGLALMIIGWIGVFFAGLIKAAVSRQREFLADASAVAYTRNPRGIGMALAHIGGMTSQVGNAHAREASHFFFASGIKNWFGAWATHPPINDRIERVLPGFSARVRSGESRTEAVAQTAPPPPASTDSPHAAVAGIAAAGITGLVGRIEPEHVEQARKQIEALPLDLVAAAHDVERVQALLYAMLLSHDDGKGSEQSEILAQCDETVRHEARSLAAAAKQLTPTDNLTLLELMVPALRQLPQASADELEKQAEALAQADGRISTFEFAVLKTVRRRAGPAAAPANQRGRRLNMSHLASEVEVVLSAIANENGAEAEAAFAAGTRQLPHIPGMHLLHRDSYNLERVDQALQKLNRVSPGAKKNLLEACAHTAETDGVIAPAEGELIRAFAEHLHCPIPAVWTTETTQTA